MIVLSTAMGAQAAGSAPVVENLVVKDLTYHSVTFEAQVSGAPDVKYWFGLYHIEPGRIKGSPAFCLSTVVGEPFGTVTCELTGRPGQRPHLRKSQKYEVSLAVQNQDDPGEISIHYLAFETPPKPPRKPRP